MKVVFDVDGTLTRTSALDGRLYAQAFRDVFGVPLPSTTWGDYRDATDRGIAEEAVSRLGCEARGIAAMRERFLDLLAHSLRRAPPTPVAGAAEMLARLRADGHTVAIATGSWAASARLKLSRAGLALDDAPLVGSDEHVRRDRIVATAVHDADDAVFVGDAAWDVRAAARVGVPFVGVDGEGDGRLRAIGGITVLADYRDVDAFYAALAAAEPPPAS